MNPTLNNWIPNTEEAPALFEIFERCFPIFPSADHNNALKLITLKTKGFEDGIFVTRVRNKIVGFAFLRKSHTPTSAKVVGGVLPEYRTKGFGHSLLSSILNYAKQSKIHEIITVTLESHPDTQKFLCANYFKEVDRVVWSNRSLELELPKIASNKARHLKKSGVQFLNGTDFEKSCPDWDHQLWTLQTSVLKDVPSAIPFSNIPFEEWRQYIELHFNNRQNSLFAVLKGKLIGSLILGKQKDGIINIEHTGVDKNYRRMGISTILKVKACALAKADGANTISTQNHQRNPMLALNFRMGFQPIETLIEMRVKVTDSGV